MKVVGVAIIQPSGGEGLTTAVMQERRESRKMEIKMGKFCSFNKYLFSACVSHTKAMDQVSGKDKMAVQDDAQASGFDYLGY